MFTLVNIAKRLKWKRSSVWGIITHLWGLGKSKSYLATLKIKGAKIQILTLKT